MTSSYLIKGNGIAAWTAAKMLTDVLPDPSMVLIQEGDEAEKLSPLAHLQVDGDSVFIRHSPVFAEAMARRGGFSLGAMLSDWAGKDTQFVHAPAEPLPVIVGFSVHDLIVRLAREYPQTGGALTMLEALRFQARAAEQLKFTPPSDDRRSPRSLLRPGIQLDGRWLTLEMRSAVLAAGAKLVKPAEAAVMKPLLTIETEAEAPDWHSLQPLFGFDRCLTAEIPMAHAAPPYQLSKAMSDGILHQLPVPAGWIATFCYDSALTSDEEALACITDVVGCDQVTTSHVTPWQAGYSAAPWHDDIVHIGSAAARLGPLFAMDSSLLAAQLSRLIRLLPGDHAQMPAAAAEYNARAEEDFWHRAEFAALPLTLNTRKEPWWQSRRAAPRPERLQRRIEQYCSRGRIVTFDADPFEAHIWQELFLGFGLLPKRSDPALDSLDFPSIMRQLGMMADSFEKTIAAMPTHADFLEKMAPQVAMPQWQRR
jgi:tryptophan 7-halogenase